jgi:hypothetical protein
MLPLTGRAAVSIAEAITIAARSLPNINIDAMLV